MAELVLVLGESGSGKSLSIRDLPHEKTFLIQATKKMLPFKGGSKKYSLITKENPDGNLYVSDSSPTIVKILKKINENKDLKYIIIDDMQYTMLNSFMKKIRIKVSGGEAFEKYNELAADYNDIINCILEDIRDNIIVFVITHIERDDFGQVSIKTVGKLVREKIKIEGKSSIVIMSDVQDGNYTFITNGIEPCKTPLGMFEEASIPNDLNLVAQAIEKFKEEM